jgi:D-xylonolactonase
MSVSLVWDAQCALGEGITWDAQSARMLFVDIHGKRVHGWTIDTAQQVTWSAPERIGWLINSPKGWVAGLQSGFARIDLEGDEVSVREWLARPFPAGSSLRANDAKADESGRIWAGSLDNEAESKPHGSLFMLDTAGGLHTADTGYCVANGPAISPDGKLFLHTDSVSRTIFAFDFNAATGQLSGKRPWKVLQGNEGHPDGMNFDAEGCLWLAHWGGGCISRYAPTGELMARIQLPVSQVTNVAFGGAELDRLFVTSARVGLGANQLLNEPLAGALFEVHGHGTHGLAPLPYLG